MLKCSDLQQTGSGVYYITRRCSRRESYEFRTHTKQGTAHFSPRDTQLNTCETKTLSDWPVTQKKCRTFAEDRLRLSMKKENPLAFLFVLLSPCTIFAEDRLRPWSATQCHPYSRNHTLYYIWTANNAT